MRYYFHLIDTDGCVEDTEGEEFDSVELAQATAIKTARSLIAHGVLEGRLALRPSIRVVDEAGGSVFKLPFVEALDEIDSVALDYPAAVLGS